jgi:hypothetical protein
MLVMVWQLKMAVLEKQGLKQPISLMRPGYCISENVGEGRRVEKKSFWQIRPLYCPAPGGILARDLQPNRHG